MERKTLETFLRRHHIAFDRYSEAKYEYDGEMVRYRPGMRAPFTWTATQDGYALVPRQALLSILTLCERAKYLQAKDRLRRVIGPHITPLQPLSFTGRMRQPAATIESNVLDVLGFS